MVPVRILIIVHFFILLFLPANNCDRKWKNRKSDNFYHLHESSQLPSDVQITTFLKKGETKSFVYDSQFETTGGGLSLTITPCTSPIKWSVKYPSNSSEEIISEETSTRLLKIFKGFYLFQLEALENASFLHLYLSTEKGGPQALHNDGHYEGLRLLKRQKRRRLTVKWNPSLVDPQVTDYCLVVSRRSHYDSLCSAQSEFRINFADGRNGPPVAESQTVIAYEEMSDGIDTQRDPFVACVGKRTHYTISALKQGQTYYFDLFAINGQSNFTYHYAWSSLTFDGRTKPIPLKDGKSSVANLKKLDGKAVFRFKVGRKSDKSLDVFIVPCGGAVDVEIATATKDKIVITHVEGFKKISIPNPGVSSRYYIKVFAFNKEELKKTTGVEVYATTKSSSKIPLPSMPQNMKINEYFPLTTCDSITVGWLAPPVQKTLRYCVVVKEGKIRELDDYRMPNQCALENRLKKSVDVRKYCIDFKDNTEQVLTRKMSHLKPGRSYIVQVTVKKPKGKTLSYDLLQVRTKPTCSNKNL